MNKTTQKKIVMTGPYEDVIKDGDHLYVTHKLDTICVLPYTISSNNILDTIGVVKNLDVLKEKELYTLIKGYTNQDDGTNLVTANRLLFEIIGSNVTKADNWMYLGNITNISGSNIILYCVNISDVTINDAGNVEESREANKFEMITANKIVASDDALFLAAYMRIFNYFYVNALKEN